MASIEVPRYIIRQLCLPAGRRTSKKPVLLVPVLAKDKKYFYRGPSSAFARMFIPFDEKGIFSGWEYRFWAMAFINKQVHTECRCCGAIGELTTEGRKKHHTQGKCTLKLLKAYQKLLKDKICVICDCRTSRQKWGVPVCCNACEQAWCEVETCPKALEFELKLIKEV